MDSSQLLALLVVLATLALFYFYSGAGHRAASGAGAPALPPSAAHQRAAAQARGAILLCGPPGSGKTTLLHQLLFGAAVRTVPSSQVQALQAPLHHEAAAAAAAAGGAAPRRLIDCPGAPRFRSQLLRYACECAAVLVVVSAAGEAEQVRGAAAALYELYTDAAVVARAPRVLVVASKADAAGALPLPRLRLALERELQRLKSSASSASSALLLGSLDVEFTFEREAPWAPPEWETAVAVSTAEGSPLRLQGVQTFLSAL
jgi:signal recognition particle receptor subunit beta